MKRLIGILVICATLIIGYSSVIMACKRSSPVSVFEVVDGADLIIRATAVEYVVEPQGNIGTTDRTTPVIRFQVEEILRGPLEPGVVELSGYLNETDDFNDHSAPYTFVRPNGRSGSCFAYTYRRGAEFLLFLREDNGSYTVEWNALAPVNEQLHSGQDPWLFWVRGYLAAQSGALPSR